MSEIEFLYLTQADVITSGFNMESAMNAVEDSLKLFYKGKTILPYKVVLDMGERERGRSNAMPAFVGGEYNVFGIKWIAGFPQNPILYGVPRATAVMILNEAEKGFPIAIMDCTLLSAMRTGAVTGVGAKYLARQDSEIVAMIGTSVQARTQLEALLVAVPGIKEVRAYDIRPETARSFSEDMSEKFGIEVRVVDTAKDAVKDADIIVTVTVADEPIVKEAWVKPGSFFSAVGSYQEEEFEVVLNSDRVVVDSFDHVMHRETPIIALMVEQGMLEKDKVIEIGAILCGDEPRRESTVERIFFSPIGMAVEDVAVTYKAYQMALEKGIGTNLGLLGHNK
jgi:ornithine cyclodeaminase